MNGKLRFVILTMFLERQLFSLRELPDGSLTMFFAPARWSMPDGKLRTFKEVHISAHSGRQHDCGYGYKIKRSGTTDDGTQFDSSIIVQDRKKRGLIYPVTSALSGLHSAYEFKMKKGDEKVELIGLTGIEEALLYTAYVTSPHTQMPRVQGFSKFTRRFEKLSFTLYVAFFHMTNFALQFHGEALPGFNRMNQEPWMTPDGTPAPHIIKPRMTELGVQKYLYKTHTDLARELLTVMPLLNEDFTNFSPNRGGFNRWPSLNDPIHSDYGIMAKCRNELYQDPRFLDGMPKPDGYRDRTDPIAQIQWTREQLAAIPTEMGVTITPEIQTRIDKYVASMR